jgi:serine/threonine protein kinase
VAKIFALMDMTEEDVKGYLHEADMLSKLPDHDNLVKYLFHITYEGRLYIFMRKYAKSLYEALTSSTKFFTEKQVIAMAVDIMQGLKELHDRGIIHRDIKR